MLNMNGDELTKKVFRYKLGKRCCDNHGKLNKNSVCYADYKLYI